MRRSSPVRNLYIEKSHNYFVTSKNLQPKIYLRSFYDLLLLLRTMTSHQGKKIDLRDIFALSLLSTEKSEMLFYYTSLYFIQ